MAKWQPGQSLVDLLDHEVQKVRKAPPAIADSILHPAYRPGDDGSVPHAYPSNPRNTLRMLPELGPVAPYHQGRKCDRCEQVWGLRFRPVTNLRPGAWDGLPETAPGETPTAYLCCSCLFPADPNNKDWQELEYRDGHYQATAASRVATPPDVGPGSVDLEPDRGEEDESSDSDYPPTPRRRKSTATASTVTPKTPHSAFPPAVRPRVQFEPDALSLDQGYSKSSEYGTPTTQFKAVAEKHRLMKLVDEVWKQMIPVYSGAYDDITAMASFSQKVKDALLREAILNDCVNAGIPLSELLLRLLILRIEPGSLALSHLQPVWHVAEWKRKHLADQNSMMQFLMKHCLHKTALADAERAYHAFRRKMSESGVELILRLRIVYNTASLSPEFARRVPDYTLPEILVRALDEALHVRVVDGLRKSYVIWRREKLEKHGRTTPDMVRETLMKIQEEIDTQLQLMPRPPRVTPAVSFQPSSLRPRLPFARRTPAPRRSETAYAAQAADGEQESSPPEEDDDYLRAIGGRAPPPTRPAVGSLGPPVPATSRFPPSTRGPVGPRQTPYPRPPIDESRQGRFTMGHANYGGCHNCGAKDHMARDCSKPMQERLRALVHQEYDWSLDDAEAMLEQGLPECLEHFWVDPDVILDYCQRISSEAAHQEDDKDK